MLLAVVAQAYAKESQVNGMGAAQDSSDQWVDKMANDFLGRALNLSPLLHAGLDDTTLGKVSNLAVPNFAVTAPVHNRPRAFSPGLASFRSSGPSTQRGCQPRSQIGDRNQDRDMQEVHADSLLLPRRDASLACILASVAATIGHSMPALAG